MTLQGKGFFIWKIRSCDSANVTNIAAAAQAAGLTHVLVKIADGTRYYNLDPNTNADLVPALVRALHDRNIAVWGWHYIYGEQPTAEAQNAVKRVKELGVDGYVINAEVEFKAPGMEGAAKTFVSELRRGLPSPYPVALSSFRFPSYHMQFPWKAFLDQCDYNMPQVYWLLATDAGAQLRRSYREFQSIDPLRPIIPTGSTFSYEGWTPTSSQILEFLNVAKSLNLSAANFYSWDACRSSSSLRPLWNTISDFSWPVEEQVIEKTIPEKLIAAMNAHSLEAVADLYSANAVHITAERTISGREAIRNWYATLMFDLLPGASYKITSSTGSEPSLHFSWTAQGTGVSISNGEDTLGIQNGKIVYHYSKHTLTRKTG